jgi:putative membrane protein
VLEWLASTIPLWKALHVTALCVWCGGLITLPLMLTRHDPAISQNDYRLIRHATHLTYTIVVTPAAVIAVVAGTWLIFLREAFVPWLFAKLVFVALLLVLHAWIGGSIVRIAEEPGDHKPPNPSLPVTGITGCAIAILLLVLAKPELDWIAFPDWLTEPRGGQLPFAVPNR